MSQPVENYDYLFRVIVIGDSGVGKTNLLLRFTRNEFERETTQTIGIDFSTKTIEIDKHLIKAQIWDTAGQDRFKSISTAFYRGSAAALLVYDITNAETFHNLNKWMSDLKKYADPNIILTLVGNKTDIDYMRKVQTSEAREFAEMHNMSYIETSALDSSNVELAFYNIIRDVFYVYQKFNQSSGLNQGTTKLQDKLIKITEPKNNCCK